ncbi:nucleotidyltransferase family protein [Paracraurococcus lichenis]|uniref:Nucleotidyltransferase family protein n=1 Tax=Paracraurococcus lichenis TaxID=3064888 RepID=A0ABT9EDV6_9PROT|nr:nucleotidyltransferase family protein [Paracraurococcus sp. LOR1-02]MDO9714379.1 nucleotidyltransferase family protein [Paracraurococcus sp. LOR1-02]
MSETAVLPVTSEALAALPELCERFGVLRLALFGSAATGHFNPEDSDIDLLVAFREPPPGGYAEAFFGLQSALVGLFGRRIDLVTEASLKNPWFRRQVLSEARQLFPVA